MFESKKIFIFGMARSGYEAAKVLLKRNNQVLICDSKEQEAEHVQEIKSLGGEVIITDHPEEYLDHTFDYMIKNPGIRKDHVCVLKAKKLKIKVINELEMSYHLLPKDVCIIGITGSNGKTTTTTLIYEILKKAKLPVHLGGNIGYPLSSLIDKVQPKDIVLLEISDHQLCDMYDFKCHISVLTNITPTHLDFHDSYEQYKEMKKRIFQHQTSQDYAIINRENKESLQMADELVSQVLYFSSEEGSPFVDECYLNHGKIYYDIDHMNSRPRKEIDLNDILLKGNHNFENIMMAILVAEILGVKDNVIREVLHEFKGVEHRLEFVLEKDHIQVYNDSKSTNNESTKIAISSFQNPIILIMGGYNRDQRYDDLLPYIKNLKKVICYGETKNKLKNFFDINKVSNIAVDTIKEASIEAYKEAKSGDVILLSPAHASWDQYDNFEQRGKDFKDNIKKLYKVENVKLP